MLFLLQKEDSEIKDAEVFTLRNILDTQSIQHKYIYMTLNELKDIKFISNIREFNQAIPVGTIQFVQTYLSIAYNINQMTPIEVPEDLRSSKFLNRKYAILDKDELPEKGYYFVKYASKLKEYSCISDIENIAKEPNALIPNLVPYLQNGLYVLSEVVNILSEFRCFILRDKVLAIQHYGGDCMVLPAQEDLVRLNEMVYRYSLNPSRPQAYTLDVAMIDGRGLSILEVHPITSIGLYGFNSSSLPMCYRLGLDWYIKHNTDLTKFSNFATKLN